MTDLILSQVLLFGSDEPTTHLPEGLAKALLGFHSGWRYVILIVLISAIYLGFQTSKGKRPFAGITKKMGLFTIIAVDMQFLVGTVLYYVYIAAQTNFNISKFKNQTDTFKVIAFNHAIGMFIAIILIHIGYSKAKKATDAIAAGKKQFIWMLFALILILVSIPWPFLYHEWGWI